MIRIIVTSVIYSLSSRRYKGERIDKRIDQWCSGKFRTAGALGSSVPLPSSPFPSLPYSSLLSFHLPSLPSSVFPPLPLPCSSLPSFLPSLPLEVCPLNPARGSEERRKVPHGSLGPAEIEFGAF